jgi:hypothetical protein
MQDGQGNAGLHAVLLPSACEFTSQQFDSNWKSISDTCALFGITTVTLPKVQVNHLSANIYLTPELTILHPDF